MKLSNKLLIGFAAAVFFLPLLGMIYVSQVNYKKGSYQDIHTDRIQKDAHFNTVSEGMSSKTLPAFTSVSVDQSDQENLYVELVQDQASGIKFENQVEAGISMTVDANGCLHLRLKADEEHRFARIIIYSPLVQSFDVKQAKDVELLVHADSLRMALQQMDTFRFSGETAIGEVRLAAEQVKSIIADEAKLNKLQADLGTADFSTSKNAFDALVLKASGKAKVELGSENDENTIQRIKHLDIQTADSVQVKLWNVQIEQCSGRFSDGTTVSGMRAANLNQMYQR